MKNPVLSAPPSSSGTIVYVGTYTGAQSKGIYAFRLENSGPGSSSEPTLQPLGLAAETANPSFLAVDSKRRLVFAAGEIDEFQGQHSGVVSAFSADSVTGKLTLINQQPSMGSGPCHVLLDRDGKNLIVANYNSGSVAVLPISADGHLSAASSAIQHSGKSINSERQSGPHAHCVTFDPANRFVFICDLGLDQILAYRLDASSGKLTPASPAYTKVKPGAGPRHLAFSPDGRFAYVLNELDSTVTAFNYDAGSGKLTEIQSCSSLPAGFAGKNSTAEIAVHPSGKWLYVSNRGHNSVVQLAIDQQKGTLSYVMAQETGGKTPRHFAILPSAKHLAIANQDSSTIRLCRIDEATGRLQAVGPMIDTPSPVCVVFMTP